MTPTMFNSIFIPCLPFLGFMIAGLVVRAPKRVITLVSISFPLGSFFLSLLAFRNSMKGTVVRENLFSWISLGTFHVPVGLQIDELSSLLIVILTAVGTLVHVYAAGLSLDIAAYRRLSAYLSLLLFFVLILILADNLLLLFLGWEGIGLCSYLLIGFRHEQKSAIQTGLQAFVKSRLGNAGIFIGLIMLGLLFGTLTYTELFAAVQAGTHEYLVLGIPISALSLITILLFAGIHAQISFLKSADPLDCPAPAVALIHASVSIAVTYFLVRCSSLFVSGFPLVLVALVGAGWIVYGGFLCFLDNSPRRMIAFSTISQTGYLFLALGMSAFSSAIFHLTVHTFLKTLLLLGISCMVFTALKDKQRNRSTYLPIAKGTFFIGMMALAGLLPFGIFLSQNGILWDMITTSLAGKIFSMVGIAGIFMTSYCSFRILYGTTSDGDHSQQEELSVPMIIPLLVLTFLTIGTSLLGFPGYVIPDLFQEYFSSFFSIQEDDLGSGWSMFGLMAIAAGAVVAGWRLAHALHRKNVPLPEVFVQKAARIQALFSVFTVLHARFAMLARTYGQALSSKGERAIVNRVSDWIMNTISRISAYGRKLHNGSVQYYACCMIIGMLIFGGVYFLLS